MPEKEEKEDNNNNNNIKKFPSNIKEKEEREKEEGIKINREIEKEG